MNLTHTILFGASLFIAACNQPTAETPPTAQPETAKTAAAVDTLWHCIGTEPFWSIYVFSDNTISLDSPGEKQYRTAITASATTAESASFAGDGIAIALKKEACSDGMSDIAYTHSAKGEFDGRKLDGCGEKK
jgi:uncharacterized membrane protein